MKNAVSMLMLAVVCLINLGLVMQCSIAGHLSGAARELFRRQMIWAGIGFALMFAVSRVNYRCWRGLAVPGLFFAAISLVWMGIPGPGPEAVGARTALRLGPAILFQPSIWAGWAVVLFMAWWYRAEEIRSPGLFWIPHGALLGLVTLVSLGADFSVALLIMLLGGVMLTLGGEKIGYMGLGFTLSLTVLAWAILHDPERMRVVFSDPWILAGVPPSRQALDAGGWAGVGLGNGGFVRHFPAESGGGFMSAVIGEELGLSGLLALIALYIVIVVLGARIAVKAPDRFGTLLGSGIVSLWGLQVLLNLLAVTALFPIRALPLPLVSQGGFNLGMSLAGVGVLLNIASETKRESGARPRFAGIPADEKQEVNDFESDRKERRVGSGPDDGPCRRNEASAIGLDGSIDKNNWAIVRHGWPGCGRMESVG